MELNPYLESLRRDLNAAAAVAGPEITRAADLLTGALDSATRLCLMEALADAAAEITTKLDGVGVEVRLRGREADLVVTELNLEDLAGGDVPGRFEQPADRPPGHPATDPDAGGTPVPPSPSAQAFSAEGADITRITLRLPESLKEAVERLAAAEGISVNAWLVRVIASAAHPGEEPPAAAAGARPRGRARLGKRITGYAQA